MNHAAPMPPGSRCTGAMLVVLLAVATVLALMWLWRVRGAETAPIGSTFASGGTNEEQGATAGSPAQAQGSSPEAAVQRQAVGAARVVGIVLDAGGEPLTGLHVFLKRLDGRASESKPRLPMRPDGSMITSPLDRHHAARTACSDSGGAFAFEEVAAAEYTLTATLGTSTSQTFTVGVGEERHVELRFPATATLLYGQVRGQGLDLDTYAVEVNPGKEARGIAVAPDGWFRSFVTAGPCRVRVKRPLPVSDGHEKLVAIAEQALVIAAGAPRVRCDFELASARIDVTLQDSSGASAADLQFVAQGRCGLDRDDVELTRSAGDGKTAFDNVPFGEWRISMRGPSAVVEAAQRVEVTAARPTAQVVLAVQRAGTLRVSARDLDGSSVPLVGAGLVLAMALGERDGADIGLAGRRRGAAEDFGFAVVPLGRAELVCEDGERDGRLVYRPFDPLPRQPVDIVAGDQNRIELRVQRRALVQLRAVDSVGREDRAARVAVFAGERQVGLPAARPSVWSGHLPPGEYRIVVERPAGSREHGLRVDRQNLEFKLRP